MVSRERIFSIGKNNVSTGKGSGLSKANALAFGRGLGHSAGMKPLRPMLVLLVLIGGCAPPPPPHRIVVIDPMRPLPLDPAWEQFARESYGARVYSLIEPA